MKRMSIIMLCIALCLAFHLQAAEIADDFDDGVIDPSLWTSTLIGEGTLQESNGTLKAKGPASRSYGIIDSCFTLIGDLDVSFEYNWTAYGGEGDARHMIVLHSTDGTQRVSINNHRWRVGSSRELIFNYVYPGGGRTVGYRGGSSVPLSGALRLMREGSIFRAYYWTSGGWQHLGTVHAFTDDVTVRLNGFNHPNNFPSGSYEIDWDNFHAEAEATEWICAPEELVVPLDIKPTSCPNPFNVRKKGVLPAAILGTDSFDVADVDVGSLLLAGVAPIRSKVEDVTTPFEPFMGKEDCEDCTTEKEDGFADLTLKFDAQEISAALSDVEDGECVVLTLTGTLLDGTPIVGEDVIRIIKKDKKAKKEKKQKKEKKVREKKGK